MSCLRIPALRLIARSSISASTPPRVSSLIKAELRPALTINKRLLHQTWVRRSDDVFSSPEESRGAGAGQPEQKQQIFVGQLPYSASPESVIEKFKKFGEITNTHTLRTQAGMSRGAMFITFDNAESAQRAIQEMDSSDFDGRRMFVALAQGTRRASSTSTGRPNLPSEPTNSLFIGNMSFNMTDKDLNEMFQRVKNCIDVRVAIDRRTGQPRGFAHADFTDAEAAKEAKAWLDTQSPHGRQLRINYAYPKRTRENSRGDHADAGAELSELAESSGQ